MKPDTSHIKQITVVSNTHWDREFRRSFEKTRRRLLTMMDVTLDILEKDEAYHSFTMDGHSIMIDDYLEMRPERRPLVERLVKSGRLIIGPYYTLAEEFSIGHEALVRNLMWGRKTVQKYGGTPTTVAYTPSSWGQTGQLPQIFADFGLKYMMFYRGISHHESDAEWIWAAPDGTRVTASRFALYARYNWYYQVHRAVTNERVFDKDYVWGDAHDVPVRIADGLAGEDLAFDVQDPPVTYDKSKLKQAILDMVEREGRHFTTPVFLAMHGHDISVAHPLESRIIQDARELLGDAYDIQHTDLEGFWAAAEEHMDTDALPVLTGERRSYLKEGMWTYLFPGTISARTYLKQMDFAATVGMAYYAEPLTSMVTLLGGAPVAEYLTRGWGYLLANHTHDANGGCAPDPVCQDMEYRYRKTCDVADIVTEDAMADIAKRLSPDGVDAKAMQLIVFNPLPFRRDAVVKVDVEVPRECGALAARLEADGDANVARQPLSSEKSSAFVDSIWEVPRILESNRIQFYARLSSLPALGYRAYEIVPEENELRSHGSLVTGHTTMENEHLAVAVNSNGTVDVTRKATGRTFRGLNYLSDAGECGNAWKHLPPVHDRVYNSRGVSANIAVTVNGPLVSEITATYEFPVPADYGDGSGRSDALVALPVTVAYRLEAGSKSLGVALTVDNRARDHWLRANFPTDLDASVSHADSHFDVVERAIEVPDSTGWIEPAFGTHPLRTFVDVSDGTNGLAVMPKGLFEYEAVDDASRTIALTLLRACRIKLMVSEEKQTELPDEGIQCPGVRRYEYALRPHAGTWRTASLLREASTIFAPPRAVMSGRGKGGLPREAQTILVENSAVHVTAVKPAEDGNGLIVRFFNPTIDVQDVSVRCGAPVSSAERCGMDESGGEALAVEGKTVSVSAGPKKIVTVRLVTG